VLEDNLVIRRPLPVVPVARPPGPTGFRAVPPGGPGRLLCVADSQARFRRMHDLGHRFDGRLIHVSIAEVLRQQMGDAMQVLAAR
jgi:hypothetical protein